MENMCIFIIEFEGNENMQMYNWDKQILTLIL